MVGFPVFWALGLSAVVFPLMAIPMAWALVRRGRIRFPPGFGLWVLFLVCVLAGAVVLGVTAPGTIPPHGAGRFLAYGARLAYYVSLTVFMLYVGNMPESKLPSLKITRMLGLLCWWTIVLGLAGVLFPHFSFHPPLGGLVPSPSGNPGGATLALSQVQPVLGYSAPRPAAPYDYTNAWGNALSLLLVWFVGGWWAAGRAPRRLALIGGLVVAAVPIVYSLNRGMWIGLVLSVLYVGVRLALRGKIVVLGAVVIGLVLVIVAFLVTPLSALVVDRVHHGHSNDVRTSLGTTAVKIALSSPVIGYGSTRKAVGSGASIAIGPTASCPQCGSREVGSTGQLWLLLTAQGFVGTAFYLLFFARIAWIYRKDRSQLGYAGVLVVLLSLFYGLFYTALTIPLAITFISVGLLWRNGRTATAVDADSSSVMTAQAALAR